MCMKLLVVRECPWQFSNKFKIKIINEQICRVLFIVTHVVVDVGPLTDLLTLPLHPNPLWQSAFYNNQTPHKTTTKPSINKNNGIKSFFSKSAELAKIKKSDGAGLRSTDWVVVGPIPIPNSQKTTEHHISKHRSIIDTSSKRNWKLFKRRSSFESILSGRGRKIRLCGHRKWVGRKNRKKHVNTWDSMLLKPL